MNKLGLVFVVCLGAFVYLLLGSDTAGASFEYEKNWSDAVAEARSTGKPILLNFGGPW